MSDILVLHGPNLNLLGSREPAIYGTQSLDDINQALTKAAETLGHQLHIHQSNVEHELVEILQQTTADFLIFNPAAFTHTSVAIRDALSATKLPFIECHLSNPHARELFRRQSYFSDIAVGVICGFGSESYLMALQAADRYLTTGN